MIGVTTTLFNMAKQKVGEKIKKYTRKYKIIEFMNTELNMPQRLAISEILGAVYKTKYERPYTNMLKTSTETATIDVKITGSEIRREKLLFIGSLIVHSSSEKEKVFKYNKDVTYNAWGSLYYSSLFDERETATVNGYGRYILSLEYVTDLTNVTDTTINNVDEIINQFELTEEVHEKWQKIRESL